jgi:arsenate reductase
MQIKCKQKYQHMNKIYYIKPAILVENYKNQPKGNDLVFRDIKQDPLTAEELEIKITSGSYEALFSKKAQLYKSMNLKDKSLTEED